jgi:pimeloyl-ACP methyl ester carboxylesterase
VDIGPTIRIGWCPAGHSWRLGPGWLSGISLPRVGVSRRTIILGGVLGAGVGLGGWTLLADARVLPGRSVLDSLLGRCDVGTPPPAEGRPGRVFRSSFYSRRRQRSVNYMLAYPPDAAPGALLPVCVCLHGYGEDERAAFDTLGYHKILAGMPKSRSPRFVFASVAGGTGYWHPHPDDDPLGMLLTEFPVVLSQHGLPVDQLALLGWSMGGYGALVAATEQPHRFPIVVANAPAFWESYDDAHSVNPGAFSSADEWKTWGDLLSRADKLRTVNARIDCGASDSFEPAISDLRDKLPDPSVVHIAKGCHDATFWRSLAPVQLNLIGQALTAPAR